MSKKPWNNPKHHITRTEAQQLGRNMAARASGPKGPSFGIAGQLPMIGAHGIAQHAVTREDINRMSRVEAAYSMHLCDLHIKGEIRGWWYEPMNLRMAPNTYYRPDFMILQKDGSTWIVDTKGRKRDSYYCKEVSKLKIKTCAAMFPLWKFFIVWPGRKGEGWKDQRIGLSPKELRDQEDKA